MQGRKQQNGYERGEEHFKETGSEKISLSKRSCSLMGENNGNYELRSHRILNKADLSQGSNLLHQKYFRKDKEEKFEALHWGREQSNSNHINEKPKQLNAHELRVMPSHNISSQIDRELHNRYNVGYDKALIDDNHHRTLVDNVNNTEQMNKNRVKRGQEHIKANNNCKLEDNSMKYGSILKNVDNRMKELMTIMRESEKKEEEIKKVLENVELDESLTEESTTNEWRMKDIQGKFKQLQGTNENDFCFYENTENIVVEAKYVIMRRECLGNLLEENRTLRESLEEQEKILKTLSESNANLREKQREYVEMNATLLRTLGNLSFEKQQQLLNIPQVIQKEQILMESSTSVVSHSSDNKENHLKSTANTSTSNAQHSDITSKKRAQQSDVMEHPITIMASHQENHLQRIGNTNDICHKQIEDERDNRNKIHYALYHKALSDQYKNIQLKSVKDVKQAKELNQGKDLNQPKEQAKQGKQGKEFYKEDKQGGKELYKEDKEGKHGGKELYKEDKEGKQGGKELYKEGKQGKELYLGKEGKEMNQEKELYQGKEGKQMNQEKELYQGKEGKQVKELYQGKEMNQCKEGRQTYEIKEGESNSQYKQNNLISSSPLMSSTAQQKQQVTSLPFNQMIHLQDEQNEVSSQPLQSYLNKYQQQQNALIKQKLYQNTCIQSKPSVQNNYQVAEVLEEHQIKQNVPYKPQTNQLIISNTKQHLLPSSKQINSTQLHSDFHSKEEKHILNDYKYNQLYKHDQPLLQQQHDQPQQLQQPQYYQHVNVRYQENKQLPLVSKIQGIPLEKQSLVIKQEDKQLNKSNKSSRSKVIDESYQGQGITSDNDMNIMQVERKLNEKLRNFQDTRAMYENDIFNDNIASAQATTLAISSSTGGINKPPIKRKQGNGCTKDSHLLQVTFGINNNELQKMAISGPDNNNNNNDKDNQLNGEDKTFQHQNNSNPKEIQLKNTNTLGEEITPVTMPNYKKSILSSTKGTNNSLPSNLLDTVINKQQIIANIYVPPLPNQDDALSLNNSYIPSKNGTKDIKQSKVKNSYHNNFTNPSGINSQMSDRSSHKQSLLSSNSLQWSDSISKHTQYVPSANLNQPYNHFRSCHEELQKQPTSQTQRMRSSASVQGIDSKKTGIYNNAEDSLEQILSSRIRERPNNSLQQNDLIMMKKKNQQKLATTSIILRNNGSRNIRSGSLTQRGTSEDDNRQNDLISQLNAYKQKFNKQQSAQTPFLSAQTKYRI